jgi:hypothetical protein
MKLVGDITKPHLHKKFKMVPMKDANGNPISDNPEIRHGGPWAPFQHGIDIGKDDRKTQGR